MKMTTLAIGAAALAVAAEAGAQPPLTLESLAQRVEALEQENAALRAEVAALRRDGEPAGPPAAVAPPAPPTPPPETAAAAPAPPAPDRWDRTYVGTSLALTRLTVIPNNPGFGPPPALSNTDVGWLASVQIGRRWQTGRLVAGVEVGFDAIRTDLVFGAGQGSPNFEYLFSSRRAFRTAGQLGVASGPWLLYAVGGIQVSGMGIRRFDHTQPGGPRLQAFTHLYTTDPFYGIGAGLRLDEHSSIEVEATRFDRSDVIYQGLNFTFPTSDEVRIRFNYLFP